MSSRKPKNIFVQGPISPQLVADCLAKHSEQTEIGAHSLFLGQVRSDAMGTPDADPRSTPDTDAQSTPDATSTDPLAQDRVKAIHYTAYEEMALEKMQEIRDSLFERYPLTCLHVYHSLGLVPTGAISLLVFTSAPHRRAAIDACTELVESIKAHLPIWGQELSDNLSHWKINK
jgi:molybdopterin synthase catalytic subunit